MYRSFIEDGVLCTHKKKKKEKKKRQITVIYILTSDLLLLNTYPVHIFSSVWPSLIKFGVYVHLLKIVCHLNLFVFHL